MDKERPILIVDDIQPARETLINMLKVFGYKNFLEASNGEEAKDVLKEHKDIQLIISDWKMPRLSGIELLKWVRGREEFKDIPFIMVTSKGEKEDIALAAEEEVTEYLVKPVGVEALISKLESIDKKSMQQKKIVEWLGEINKLIKEEKFDEVSKKLEDFTKKFPKLKVKLRSGVAQLYLRHGKIEEAEKIVDVCISENSLFEKAWIIKSDIALMKKDFESAISALKKVYELNPNSSKVLYKMGRVYLEMGKQDEAKRCFLMAHNFDPDNKEMIQDIWNLYLEKGLVDEVARDFGHVFFEHLTVETLNNLAVSLSKKQNIKEAINTYRHALKKDPDNPKIHYNTAVAYLKLGNEKNALNHLNKAIELEPKFEKAQSLVDKLLEKERNL